MDAQVQSNREIRRLKIENDLCALAESQENRQLKAEIKRLEDLKAELNKTIDRLMSDTAPRAPTRNGSDGGNILRNKEIVVERQSGTIKKTGIKP